MSTLAGAGAGAAVGSTVTRTAGQQVAKRGAIGFGARLLGSRLLGFLGGPLGLALSIGIPLLIEVIGGLTNSVDKNTEALNSDDNKASIQERNQQALLRQLGLQSEMASRIQELISQ